MPHKLFLAAIVLSLFTGCATLHHITKISMYLSAFGLESDNFPTIEATIDLEKGIAVCHKSYYNPELKPSTYYLSKDEVTNISNILKNMNFEGYQKNYAVVTTDQPTSTLIIYTDKEQYIIEDYGLEGNAPLPELYNIVYKLDKDLNN
jgi:hypothetical protein